jgi:hypothetical protein
MHAFPCMRNVPVHAFPCMRTAPVHAARTYTCLCKRSGAWRHTGHAIPVTPQQTVASASRTFLPLPSQHQSREPLAPAPSRPRERHSRACKIIFSNSISARPVKSHGNKQKTLWKLRQNWPNPHKRGHHVQRYASCTFRQEHVGRSTWGGAHGEELACTKRHVWVCWQARANTARA